MATVTPRVVTPSTSDTGTYVSDAFTPAADELLVVFVVVSDSPGSTVSCTGSAASFTGYLDRSLFRTTLDQVFAFVSTTAATATSQTVTFTCTADPGTGCIIWVAGVSGMSKFGLSAIRNGAQFATMPSNQSAGATPSITLPVATLTGNPVLGFVGNNGNPASVTPPTGFTEHSDTGYSTPTTGGEFVSRDSGHTANTVVWGSTSPTTFNAFAVELDASPISLRTAGSWVAATATTQTVTLPTHATGDMLLVRVGFKHAVMPTTVTCGTAGWAKIGEKNGGTNISGNGTGSVQVATFWKQAASASETNPVITFNAGIVAATPSCAVALAYQKGASAVWDTPVGDGTAIAAATSIADSIDTHISATVGDLIDEFHVTNDNTTLTVPTFTQTGLTLDTVAESPATALTDATSNDISADGCYRKVTAGTSSAAAAIAGTNSVADEGAGWTTRLRVAAAAVADTPFPYSGSYYGYYG